MPLLPPIGAVSVDQSQLVWEWQLGTPTPDPKPLRVCSFAEALDYTVTATTNSGSAWLSAPASGRSFQTTGGCFFAPATAPALAVRVDPTGLPPGNYTGTLALTPAGDNVFTTTVNVTLIVGEKPFLSVTPTIVNFNYEAGTASPPPPRTFQVTTNGPSAEFTAEAAFESGGAWFTFEPARATAPSEITVTADPSGLGLGIYAGSITIRGPGNEQTVRVAMNIFTRTIRTEIRPMPEAARFTWRRGSAAPEPLRVGFPPIVLPVSFTVQADTPPGNWLSAFSIEGPGVPGIGVRVDPTGLADGVYRGSLTIRSDNPNIIAEPARLPVELTVWTTAPPLTVSPASLEFFAGPGNLNPSAKLAIATGSLSVDFTTALVGESNWLSVSPPIPTPPAGAPPLTPANLTVEVQGFGLLPGSYSTTLRITAGGSSVDVPVKLTKTGMDLHPFGPPTVGAVANGASLQPGAISPGAIITLLGFPLAPRGDKLFEIADGRIATRLNGTRVLFDGIPAPLLYVSPTQINAIVPYEVAGSSATVMEVEAPEIVPGALYSTFGRSPAQAVAVAAAAPSLFTLSGTGAGQAAALNQDNTHNGPQSPAAPGSILQLYATGEGLLSPAPETGALAADALARPLLPVSVTIGGVAAPVLYAGPSPGSVFGLLQVNVTVPQRVNTGPAVPVLLTVGGFTSPEGVTVAIR